MEMIIKRIPSIRFSEFQEGWVEKKMKDISKINQGLQIAIAQRFTKEIKGSFFYITNEFLRSSSKKKYFIMNPPDSVICDKDDILMTRTGNTGMVVTNVAGAFHNNFFKIDYRGRCIKGFLFYFLNLDKTQHTLLKLAGTSTIPDLNHGDFYKIGISLPSLPEQQKIADFLSVVDKKIQLLTRKKKHLEEYKKGVMQKIFSREIRFKHKNGNEFQEWEEKRLGEIFTINAGGDISRENVSPLKDNHYKYPVYSNSEKEKGLYGYSDLFKVEKACITVSGRGTLGIAIARNEKFYPIVRLLVLIPLHPVDIKFFENRINFMRFFVESTGVPQLTRPQLSQYSTKYPCFEEQKLIAGFLSRIDDKIQATQSQISLTQQFKKGLLQQMFV